MTNRVAWRFIIGVPLRHGKDKLGLEKGTTRFGKGVTQLRKSKTR